MQRLDHLLFRLINPAYYQVLWWEDGAKGLSLEKGKYSLKEGRVEKWDDISQEEDWLIVEKSKLPTVLFVVGQGITFSGTYSKSFEEEALFYQEINIPEPGFAVVRMDYLQGVLDRLARAKFSIAKVHLVSSSGSNYYQEIQDQVVTSTLKEIVANPWESRSTIGLSDYVHHRFFYFFTRTALAVLLLVTIGNAFLFMRFNRENQQLQEKTAEVTAIQELITDTKANVSLLKSQVVNTGQEKVAFRLDELAKTVPAAVQLDGLDYGIKKVDPISRRSYIDPKESILRGESTHLSSLMQWSASLSEVSWVERVLDSQLKEQKEGVYTFSIKLKHQP